MPRKATFIAAMLVMGLHEVCPGPEPAPRPLASPSKPAPPHSAPPQVRQAVLQDTRAAVSLADQDRPLAARTAPDGPLERVESGGARLPPAWSAPHRPTLYRF